MPRLIPVADLNDPRLADYADVRERQLAEEFSAHPRPGKSGGAGGAGGAGGDPSAPAGKFMAEGEVVFQRLVDAPFPTRSVLCTPARLATIGPLLERLPAATPVYVIEPEALRSLVGFNLHRGLMAIGERLPPRRAEEVIARAGGRSLLVLENLANHDNIGACFRNAACFGAGGVLLSPSCADPLYRKATRVAVGYTLTLPFATLTPWPEAIATLRAAGYLTLALTPAAGSVPLRDALGPGGPAGQGPVALLVGAEGPGLSAQALAAADFRVRIPMAPGTDSLNVAVASAIALEQAASRLDPKRSVTA